VLFVKGADFQSSHFQSELTFWRATFGGDVHFEETQIPEIFRIEDSTFIKGLYATPEQFVRPTSWWAPWREGIPTFTLTSPEETSEEQTEVLVSESSKEIRGWRELQHGFNAAGNLEMENYALFHLRSADERLRGGWPRFQETFSRWFWGFGVRPFRVLSWLGGVVLAFAMLYRTQLKGSSHTGYRRSKPSLSVPEPRGNCNTATGTAERRFFGSLRQSNQQQPKCLSRYLRMRFRGRVRS
jgi:hypothetical protein